MFEVILFGHDDPEEMVMEVDANFRNALRKAAHLIHAETIESWPVEDRLDDEKMDAFCDDMYGLCAPHTGKVIKAMPLNFRFCVDDLLFIVADNRLNFVAGTVRKLR